MQASIEDATIRDHVKNSLLPPPRLEDDRDDGQAFKVYLVRPGAHTLHCSALHCIALHWSRSSTGAEHAC